MATKQLFNPLLRKRFQQISVSTGNGAYTQSVQTTDATQTTLPLSQSITSDSIQSFVIRITAIEPATGDSWFREYKGAIKNISGTTSIVGVGVPYDSYAEDTGAATWDVSVEANDSTDALDIKVTGEAAHTIEWYSSTVFNEITF